MRGEQIRAWVVDMESAYNVNTYVELATSAKRGGGRFLAPLPSARKGRRQQPRPHQHVVEVRQERRHWSSGSLAGREL
jgi:hypothetical protein